MGILTFCSLRVNPAEIGSIRLGRVMGVLNGTNFGSDVAISGNTVVVAAIVEDSNATGVDGDQSNNSSVNSGAAYIFVTNRTFSINAGLYDAWNDPMTDGQGFFITVFPDLGLVTLSWFTYDTELPPMDATANLGDPGHRWFNAAGLIQEGSNQVIMDIDFTSGGIFDTYTEIEHTDPPGSAGTIILTFDSCNSATIEYDILSINQQGTVPIRRVADDNIVICEALSLD